MNSCIYEGWVGHKRYSPTVHHFRYRLSMLYVDLDELDTVFRGRWFWSTRRPNIAWFRRGDYLGDPQVPLDSAVRNFVECKSGQEVTGPIRLLTHPRYFGYGMNPVSFYYCFDSADQQVDWIVAEVTNTPWGESHCYLLDGDGRVDGKADLDKVFHVSPFMPMDMQYRWRLQQPGDELAVAIENYREGERVFDAALNLQRRRITAWNLMRVLLRFPFMTAQVAVLIYWQAFRLWWKSCPFYPHPSRAATSSSSEGLVSDQQSLVPDAAKNSRAPGKLASLDNPSCTS